MTPDSTFNLVIVSLLLGAQWLMRPSVFFRTARIIFWSLVFGVLFLSFYLTYEQYQLWQAHPLSQFLLPPYRGIGYFFSYVSVNFFLPIAANLLFAPLAVLVLGLVNKRFKGRLFESSEHYLAGIAILLSGSAWPVLFLVLAGTAFFGSVVNLFLKRSQFSLEYFWLPATIFTILIVNIVSS